MIKIDKTILKFLDKKPSYPSEIARKINLSRTTIQYRLSKLQNLGLVKKTIKGKKSMWSLKVTPFNSKKLFQIYKGKDFVNVYNRSLTLPKNSTIFGIQGSMAAQNNFKNFYKTFIKNNHRISKKRRFILKVIINKKALEALEKVERSLIESHLGRTLGVKMFSNDSFNGYGEIISTKKFITFANQKNKKAIIITDKEIVKIFYEMMNLLFESLSNKSSFNLNSYIKEVYL